jgi:vacuolar-type H+-ATPase subunit F/Vma7
VDEKFTTFGQLSNKSKGYELNEVHWLNADANEVASPQLSNNPEGIAVIVVNEKISEKIDTLVAYWNKSDGIVEIDVLLIKPANDTISFNP